MEGNFGKRNSDLSAACANAPAKLPDGSPNCNPTLAATDAPDSGPLSMPTLWHFSIQAVGALAEPLDESEFV